MRPFTMGKLTMLTRHLEYEPSTHLASTRNTNNHKDVEHVFHEWRVIVVFGEFEGGDACFPELGVKIRCTSGV